MKEKSIKKNYILNVAYQILTIIVPFITTPYISRVLQAEGVGAYSYTLAIASYIGVFATVGMDVYGQLQTAKCRDDRSACGKLVGGIFMAKLVTTSVTISIYFILEPQIGMYGNLYWIMILYFLSILMDFTWFFEGMEEFAYIVGRNILVKGAGIVLIFIFVRDISDVGIYAIIMQGTVLAGNLLVIPYLCKFIKWIPIFQLKIGTHLKGGIIYFVPTIATSVYTMLDKAMIGWVTKSAYENGYYEQAYKIVQMALIVVTSLRTVTLPRVVRLYSEKQYNEVKDMVDNSIRFVLCFSLPMCIGLMVVAPQLIPVFLGEGYEKCIYIVQILSVLIVVLGLSNLISGQCLTATGKQKQANICVIVGAIINFIINLILIPRYGALGATIATVCAETIIMLMFLAFGSEYLKMNKIGKNFVRYFLCSLIMAAVIYGLKKMGLQEEILLLCEVLVGVIAYFTELVIIRDDLVCSFIYSIKEKFNKRG